VTFYIILTFAAFLLSLLGTRIVILAWRQRPAMLNARGQLHKPTPRSGGVAVVMALIICLLIADIHYAVILAMFLLAAVSLLDDIIGVPLPVRLLVQLLAVLIVLSVVPIPVFGGWLPGWADKAVTAMVWLWFINLFDFMDGIDGMSPTEMIGIGMGFCLITVIVGAFPDPLSVYSLIIVAAGWGFLWWNWHPAKIFLGEVGTIPIGFLLGYMLLLASLSGYGYAAAILPAYYLSDATITLIYRAYKGKAFWGVHPDYYYQHAVRKGRRHDTVVRYVFGVNLLLVLLATFSVLNPELAILHLAIAYMAVFMILGFFAYTAPNPHDEPF